MGFYTKIDEIIGKTPLARLKNIEKELNLKGRLFAKLEYLNPAGSTKDRAALNMINEAEEAGLIDKDTVIIEPTSGNTGIGLAAIGASRGYRVVIVMPDTMSVERQKLMTAYGAELVLTDGVLGMKGSIEKAEELKKQYKKAFIPDQFNNKANARAHFKTTGPEIYEDLDGSVDVFVATFGTGGTITGTGRYLKMKNSATKVIGIEPKDSPLLTEGRFGPHKIQGIGANFIPTVLDTSVIDEIETVTTEEAYEAARLLGKKEGYLVGISSGAALAKAIKQAELPENEGKNVVALLPDTGDRYLSTDLF